MRNVLHYQEKMKSKFYIFMLVPPIVSLPWVFIKFLSFHTGFYTNTILSGISIVCAAFYLAWASDSLRRDVSGALSMALVALIAVLPEYGVDMYLSFKAGQDISYAQFAAANMTGANRLLIGFGWALVVLLSRGKEVILPQERRSDATILAVATLWCFTLSFRKHISLIESIVLISLFFMYIKRISSEEVEDFENESEPVRTIISYTRFKRILVSCSMFIWSGFCILISVESFSEGLIHIGKSLNIDEFLLIQWIAPLASESPELIIASIWAVKGRPSDSITTLISSKINQWTLLIGMIPIVFNISRFFVSSSFSSLPLDPRQVEEVFLTCAQSIFAYSVILDLRFSKREAVLLFVLFSSQLFIPSMPVRYIFSAIYIFLTFVWIVIKLKSSGREKNT